MNDFRDASVGYIVQELCESRWPSWAVCPNKPSGFHGRKAILNHALALVSACPEYVNQHLRTLSNTTEPLHWVPIPNKLYGFCGH